jgi:XPA protein C-terminus
MLTEEELERIRQNRERALEIQKRKRDRVLDDQTSIDEKGTKKLNLDEDLELEDFEVNASKFVTRKEAREMYCLPDGTLAVCTFTEKENPHGKRLKPMKLFERAEIRRRARERFGGLAGLIEERDRRKNKKFQNALESTKNIFK